MKIKIINGSKNIFIQNKIYNAKEKNLYITVLISTRKLQNKIYNVSNGNECVGTFFDVAAITIILNTIKDTI